MLKELENGSMIAFETVGHGTWKLAIVALKKYGGLNNEFRFVNEDKTRFIRTVYSGGNSGGGIDIHDSRPFGDEFDNAEFIDWYKNN